MPTPLDVPNFIYKGLEGSGRHRFHTLFEQHPSNKRVLHKLMISLLVDMIINVNLKEFPFTNQLCVG